MRITSDVEPPAGLCKNAACLAIGRSVCRYLRPQIYESHERDSVGASAAGCAELSTRRMPRRCRQKPLPPPPLAPCMYSASIRKKFLGVPAKAKTTNLMQGKQIESRRLQYCHADLEVFYLRHCWTQDRHEARMHTCCSFARAFAVFFRRQRLDFFSGELRTST